MTNTDSPLDEILGEFEDDLGYVQDYDTGKERIEAKAQIYEEAKQKLELYCHKQVIETRIDETKLWKAGFKAATEKYSDDESVVSVAQKLYETADYRIAELKLKGERNV